MDNALSWPLTVLRHAPVVGRDVELAALARRADAAVAGTGASFAFVVGEPGIGKTRLVQEVAERYDGKGVRVLRGRAARAGNSGMRPFVEAMLALARTGWSPPDGLGPYLAVLGRLVPDWRSAGVPAANAVAPFVYAEAILRAFSGTDTVPTLLILEDLHDADPDTIAALDYLIDNVAGQRLAVICTMRDVSCAAVELAEYARRRDPETVLALRRLDAMETAELAAALLGTDDAVLPEELHELLIRDGVGNPLLAIEILRELVASRDLDYRDGVWTLNESVRLHAPRTLAHGLADQMRRLGTADRRVLEAAAVLGEEFPADLVAAVAHVEESDLWSALDCLVQEQLLVPAAREQWFAIRHPLLQRAILDQLSPSVLKDIALMAAVATETRGAMTEEWWIRAAELRQSAGDVVGAGRHFAAAGRNAAEHGSPALAADLLQRALACFPEGRRDAEWAELTGLLVSALGLSGRYDEAFNHIAEVTAAQEAGLPGPASADLHIRFARLALRAGMGGRVTTHVQAISAAIADIPAAAQRAELYSLLAFVALDTYASSQFAHVESSALAAIEAARELGLPTVECDALLTLTYHYGTQNPEQALTYCRDASRVARDNGLVAQHCEALVILGVNQWYWNIDTAGLEAAEREASSVGAVMEMRFAQLSLAMTEIAAGRFDAAQAITDDAWDDISRLRMPRVGAYALAIKAVLCAHRGREAELAETVAAFDQWRGADKSEVPQVRGLALGVAALLRGAMTDARAHFKGLREFDGRARITKYFLCGEFGLGLLVEAVEGSAGWGRYHEISAQGASGMPWNRQFVEFTRALLAGRDGDAAEADRSMARALATAEPFPLARHLALRMVSPIAARDGWGEPVRWLRESEAYFETANIPAAARCCRDELRKLGESTRQRRQGNRTVPHDLWIAGVTVREYEVLHLIAEHRTNREIGSELRLSHRTVERHVSNLLTKTGTANRRELGALAVPD